MTAKGDGQTAHEALAKCLVQAEPDDCWPWQGARDDKGYGSVRICGRQWKAHRLVYETVCGPIPAGLLIRHTCDNPPCCNPRHLLLGTGRDNSRDMVERRRSHFGERAYQARLTDQDVVSIRSRHSNGETVSGLAREFGVSRGAIQGAIYRRTWKHVADVAS